jgi:hypothetical protein
MKKQHMLFFLRTNDLPFPNHASEWMSRKAKRLDIHELHGKIDQVISSWYMGENLSSQGKDTLL